MTLNEVLIILQNRLINLQETRKLAVSSGNLEQVASIDNDIGTTLISIDQLKVSLGL
jgi:hypothetical protein